MNQLALRWMHLHVWVRVGHSEQVVIDAVILANAWSITLARLCSFLYSIIWSCFSVLIDPKRLGTVCKEIRKHLYQR